MSAKEVKCRAYPFMTCVGREHCGNESCARKGSCCSTVLVSSEAEVTCGLTAHDDKTKHRIELKEHFGDTMVTITWPSRKDPFG